MLHLPDPSRYVFDKTFNSPEHRRHLAEMSAFDLTAEVEKSFLERWSFCGVDLKDPVNGYTNISSTGPGREHGFHEVCGDCLGQLDERRRVQGLPSLQEERHAYEADERA